MSETSAYHRLYQGLFCEVVGLGGADGPVEGQMLPADEPDGTEGKPIEVIYKAELDPPRLTKVQLGAHSVGAIILRFTPTGGGMPIVEGGHTHAPVEIMVDAATRFAQATAGVGMEQLPPDIAELALEQARVDLDAFAPY